MASMIQRFLFLSLLLHSILLVTCDEEDDVLRGINSYRATLNLPPLTKTEEADCLADDIAELTFKNRPCNSTSGPNAPPASDPRPADYANLLTKCRLNTATTQIGQILPACVPETQLGSLITNFTNSRYNTHLNDSRYTGIGIGEEDDWIVVVLTTSTSTPGTPGTTPATPGTTPATPGPGASPATPGASGTPSTGSSNPDNGAAGLTAISPVVFLLIGLLVLV